MSLLYSRLAHFLEFLDGVFLGECERLFGKPVQGGGFPGLLHVFGGDLEEFDMLGAEATGVQPPGPGIRKGVQDLAANGDGIQKQVIVALVEEKTRFSGS